jgi:hypothetical protein
MKSDHSKCQRCSKPPITDAYGVRLCDKHYRFTQMRVNAKREGKKVPSYLELEQMLPKRMICQSCRSKMFWRRKDGGSLVVSLQHNRDGTMAIICMRCNIKHVKYPGDLFFSRDKNCKWCPGCNKEVLLKLFPADKRGHYGVASRCRECRRDYLRVWNKNARKLNPEKFRNYFKKWYYGKRMKEKL